MIEVSNRSAPHRSCPSGGGNVIFTGELGWDHHLKMSEEVDVSVAMTFFFNGRRRGQTVEDVLYLDLLDLTSIYRS